MTCFCLCLFVCLFSIHKVGFSIFLCTEDNVRPCQNETDTTPVMICPKFISFLSDMRKGFYNDLELINNLHCRLNPVTTPPAPYTPIQRREHTIVYLHALPRLLDH